ncbi:MAG: hypothetical protein K5905_08360 [Roseibium sp.]|uniref:hypothetical protein n=1 Tax=Roseibium sp. TaxID=1936156 RepID=UPI0026212017|nr:hypothetical protein [Roseibium sp.]MCV0425473.1 hypothetical protein [Roseibium sp.]
MMQTLRSALLLGPVLFWLAMMAAFIWASRSPDPSPPIAAEGLRDLWQFYLPLMLFTLATVFYFTRNRTKPTWQGFGVARHSIKQDLALALAYLIAGHLILGSLFNVGLHFPGPEVFAPGVHNRQGVLWWAGLQATVFVVLPYFWLRRRGFDLKKLVKGIDWKRDIWLMIAFWGGEFFTVAFISDFFDVAPADYSYAIPFGILANTVGAGLPVLVMIHLIILPRLSLLLDNQLLVIMLGGLVYATFSLFDPGTSYATATNGWVSVSYIFLTQTLIGMGKAAFTVRTGNPFIHFTSYHILGARVAFDTSMYADIFRR